MFLVPCPDNPVCDRAEPAASLTYIDCWQRAYRTRACAVLSWMRHTPARGYLQSVQNAPLGTRALKGKASTHRRRIDLAVLRALLVQAQHRMTKATGTVAATGALEFFGLSQPMDHGSPCKQTSVRLCRMRAAKLVKCGLADAWLRARMVDACAAAFRAPSFELCVPGSYISHPPENRRIRGSGYVRVGRSRDVEAAAALPSKYSLWPSFREADGYAVNRNVVPPATAGSRGVCQGVCVSGFHFDSVPGFSWASSSRRRPACFARAYASYIRCPLPFERTSAYVLRRH